MTKSIAAIVTLAAAMAAPSIGIAQELGVRAGVAARSEYTDNYFYTGDDPQWAFTASIVPFVTAERRTETSEAAAILAVGGNRVWGPSPVTDYWSARLGLDGALRDAKTTWTGNVSYFRNPSLQNTITPAGVFLALAYLDNAVANGAVTYQLTERWSIGATAGAYLNRYDAVESDGTFQNNRGYYAGGTAGYLYSDATQVRFSAVYSYFSSDLTTSDYVTATAGVMHRFSPQLTVSATVGGFWSSTDTAPGVPPVPNSRDRGWLFGGSLDYAPSERTRLYASLSESIAPSGTGAITKSEAAGASLTHVIAERLSGRAGISYSRTSFPTATSGSFDQDTLAGEIGATYRIAERWTIDCGYRYSRTNYSQNVPEPASNVVFLSIAYNWPGATFTGWVGTSQDTPRLPGAGPVTLPDRSPAAPRAPSGSTGPSPFESSPFDRLPLP